MCSSLKGGIVVIMRLGYNRAASFNALSRFRRLGVLILDWLDRSLGKQNHVGGTTQQESGATWEQMNDCTRMGTFTFDLIFFPSLFTSMLFFLMSRSFSLKNHIQIFIHVRFIPDNPYIYVVA